MQTINSKVVATTLLLIAGVLLLNIDRQDRLIETMATIAAAAPAKRTAAEPVAPDARPAPDGASLERFKARVAQFHQRPLPESTTLRIDGANPPELGQSLRILRDELTAVEGQLEEADQKIQQLEVALAVPPDLQASAPGPAAIDPEAARPYEPYFAAVRQRVQHVRMRDLLRLQVQQEEIATTDRVVSEDVDFDR